MGAEPVPNSAGAGYNQVPNMYPTPRTHIILMKKGSADDLGRFSLGWVAGCTRIKGLHSAFKQASEKRQGFTRQRLNVQGRRLEAQGTGQRRGACEAPSGSPKWVGVAESGRGREDALGRQYAPP